MSARRRRVIVQVAFDVPLTGCSTIWPRARCRRACACWRSLACANWWGGGWAGGGVAASAAPFAGGAGRAAAAAGRLAGAYPLCRALLPLSAGQTLFTALPTALRNPPRRALAMPPVYALMRLALAWQPPGRAARQLALCGAAAAGPLALDDEARAASAGRQAVARMAGRWLAGAGDASAGSHDGELRPGADRRAARGGGWAELGGFSATLLDGITGSGKTEVYLQWIAQALAAGRQALVLVPEINLTPAGGALSRAFSAHADGLPAQQSGRRRARASLAGRLEGRARLVIGTRLAVFTPLPELGLIVVDEEHDGSFKQQDGLRYHARDLAVARATGWRAGGAGLGHALAGKRGGGAGRPLSPRPADPPRQRRRAAADSFAGYSPPVADEGLSAAAWQALADGPAAGETSLVFINRRGWAPVLALCGLRLAIVLPALRGAAGAALARPPPAMPPLRPPRSHPARLPQLRQPDLKPLGQGTQRIEAALRRQFPQARIARIDRDTVSRRDAWAEIDRQVRAGELDILVGIANAGQGP